jgi:hypothetical protein
MQLSRRWLDWQPPQVSPIPHPKQLTKPTKFPESKPKTRATESFVSSVSPSESRPKFIPPFQTASALDGYSLPAMPPGVKLVRWGPLPTPVQINRCEIVTDTRKFIESTLRQLAARLRGEDWAAGNWGMSELIGRLEAVGVTVELQDDRRWLH